MTVHMTFGEDGACAWTTVDRGGPLSVSVVDPLALPASLAAAWDDLARAASEANVFAERWCLQPALHLLDPHREARLVVVRSGADGPLVGVIPLAVARRYGPLPFRHNVGWSHANHFHGAPLVRAGAETAFWHALLGWCDHQLWARALLQLPRLTEGGPLHRALDIVASERGGAAVIVHREARALLESDLDPAAYWDSAMRGKKRKELRRQANRLADEGVVSFHHWTAGDDAGPWIDDFLTLEARGWKGQAASALASQADTDAWFRAIMAGAAAAGRLDMRMMRLDDRPLAMLINFLCPPGGFSFKTAFDEEYARFSPGVLLQQANLDLLARPELDWVDSCAQPDHSMIDSIWQERRALVWVNVPLGGRMNRLRFAALTRLEAVWRKGKALRNRPKKQRPIKEPMS